MNPEGIEQLLQHVRQGQVSVEQALQRLRSLPFEDLGFASLDHHRSLRQGFPEVVLCEGKTTVQVVGIARALITKQRLRVPFAVWIGAHVITVMRALWRFTTQDRSKWDISSWSPRGLRMCPWRKKPV
jgi:NCAIR mutase (PurE)-related protein